MAPVKVARIELDETDRVSIFAIVNEDPRLAFTEHRREFEPTHYELLRSFTTETIATAGRTQLPESFADPTSQLQRQTGITRFEPFDVQFPELFEADRTPAAVEKSGDLTEPVVWCLAQMPLVPPPAARPAYSSVHSTRLPEAPSGRDVRRMKSTVRRGNLEWESDENQDGYEEVGTYRGLFGKARLKRHVKRRARVKSARANGA
jgi:hypothetical protein